MYFLEAESSKLNRFLFISTLLSFNIFLGEQQLMHNVENELDNHKSNMFDFMLQKNIFSYNEYF